MSQVSLSRLQTFYGALDAEALLRVIIRDEFKGKSALISSFGADAALLLSLVAEIDKATPILFLETGKHFPETLDYAKTLTRHLGLSAVHWLKPDPEMLKRTDPKGDLWSTTPNRCCWLRKVEPLERAVNALGIQALITGRKRYQTSDRADMETIELDEKGLFRINPLAFWDKERQKKKRQNGRCRSIRWSPGAIFRSAARHARRRLVPARMSVPAAGRIRSALKMRKKPNAASISRPGKPPTGACSGPFR